MKKVIIIIICVLLAAVIAVVATLGAIGYYSYQAIKCIVNAPEVAEDDSLVIMSANIRRQEKIITFKKEDTGTHRWYKRAKYYLKNIEVVSPDILAAQEVQPGQFKFLTEHLKGYGSVVGYRDNEGRKSESCPIFYSEARFELLDGGIFWLTDTPNVMSRHEGCFQYRIATFAKLKDKSTGLVIAIYNAHPDWTPAEARKEELKVVAAQAQASDADKVVVLGDLNADKHTESGAESLAAFEAFLKDSKTFDGMEDYGNTFQGYGLSKEEALDYIYLPSDTTVLEAGKLDAVYNGVYPSDHYPIYAKVKF